MKRYVIERDLPGIGGMNRRAATRMPLQTSNSALAKLAGKCQWEHSYVVDNKTFCIYLAENEAAVKEHAKLSGFPATKITEVRTVHRSLDGGGSLIAACRPAFPAKAALSELQGRRVARSGTLWQSGRRTVLLARPRRDRRRQRKDILSQSVRLDVARAAGEWRQLHASAPVRSRRRLHLPAQRDPSR